MNQGILEVKNIWKEFPGVIALKGIDETFLKGEVHAIVGENGAGKSTLIKIISGVFPPNKGEIFLKGKKIRFSSPIDAKSHGIVTIFQELSVLPNLSVAENIFIGQEKSTLGFLSYKDLYKRTEEILKLLEISDISPSTITGKLSVAYQQLVEIGRAVSGHAEVIIMDEPTSSLTENEVRTLFGIIKKLKASGVTVIYISHKLEEVFQIADRVTVMRDGEKVGVYNIDEITEDRIVELMVGRKLESYYVKDSRPLDEVVLEVRGFTGERFKDVSFNLKKGEILGFSGLVGAGRTELMMSLFGFLPYEKGEIYVKGKRVDIKSPLDAIRYNMGLVPEDRKLQGLILIMTVRENITLPGLDNIKTLGFIRLSEEYRIAKQKVKELSIRTPSVDQKVLNLSGGNQQKVVLAKWLNLRPDILILDEPTRGIDVGAKAEIYRLMNDMAKEGISIIMVSSELPEILAMSDRAAIMAEGELTAILGHDEITEEKIMHYATPRSVLSKAS